MIGRELSHYRIVERLGAGGMGVVYRARDLRLDRDVVLKFLAPGLVADPEARSRLLQEAQAASALDHPNICTIYEIDQSAEGEQFIAMACYEGEVLSRRIARGPLAVDEVVALARQLAAGLAAAHARGIVHRDVKPGNLFVTDDGTLKILDFGLAKLAGAARLTLPGTALGTVAYMAPEQLRAEEVDARADVWSFGAVLYEMLAGRPPFGGSGHDTVGGILAAGPAEPVERVRPEVPPRLRRLVRRALAKDPAERFADLGEVADDLGGERPPGNAGPPGAPTAARGRTRRRALAVLALLAAALAALGLFAFLRRDAEPPPAAAAAPRLARLAVLPFSQPDGGGGADYLGYALADRVVDRLSYAEGILVRPVSVAREDRHLHSRAAETARRLKVEYLVSGDLEAAAGRLRLSVDLRDPRREEPLWRDRFEVDVDDTYRLERLVADGVIRGLELRPAARTPIEADVPSSPLAYDDYLRSLSYPLDLEGNALALELLDRSLSLDPEYAPAWAEVGNRRRYAAVYALGGAATVEQAEQAFRRALDLNGDLLDALSGLAKLSAERGDAARACGLLRRALEINPDHAESHFSLSYAYRYAGLITASARQGEIALALDPGNPRFRSVATTHLYAGDLERALEVHRIEPDSGWTLARIGQIHLRRGDRETAREFLARAGAREAESSTGRWSTAMLAALDGVPEQGLEALLRNEEAGMVDGEQIYHIANVHCLLGDRAGCLRLLAEALDHGFFNLPFMERDAFLDPVRDEPAFHGLLAAAAERQREFRRRCDLPPAASGATISSSTGAGSRRSHSADPLEVATTRSPRPAPPARTARRIPSPRRRSRPPGGCSRSLSTP